MSQADDELDVYHRRVFYGFGWWNRYFFGPNDAESVGNDQNDIIIFFLVCSITSVESSR